VAEERGGHEIDHRLLIAGEGQAQEAVPQKLDSDSGFSLGEG